MKDADNTSGKEAKVLLELVRGLDRLITLDKGEATKPGRGTDPTLKAIQTELAKRINAITKG